MYLYLVNRRSAFSVLVIVQGYTNASPDGLESNDLFIISVMSDLTNKKLVVLEHIFSLEVIFEELVIQILGWLI